MDLNILFKVIPCRIEYFNSEECEGTRRPCIKVFDEKQNVEIVFGNMFNNKDNILDDFRTLASTWNELLIDNNQDKIADKHIEIAEFIGGKSHVNDVLTIIYWLQKKCDIDNDKLIQLIEASYNLNKIYTIMVMEDLTFDEQTEYPVFNSSRVVGWYSEFEDAYSSVLGNCFDINETCYQYAIIEECEEGIYKPSSRRWFF